MHALCWMAARGLLAMTTACTCHGKSSAPPSQEGTPYKALAAALRLRLACEQHGVGAGPAIK